MAYVESELRVKKVKDSDMWKNNGKSKLPDFAINISRYQIV